MNCLLKATMSNPFFKNNGPLKIFDILKILKIDNKNFDTETNVLDINDLLSAKNNEITFFHSKKYTKIARNTKASFCITTENLKNELPNNCVPLIVKNVLVSVSKFPLFSFNVSKISKILKGPLFLKKGLDM